MHSHLPTSQHPYNRRRFIRNGVGIFAGGMLATPRLSAQAQSLLTRTRKALGSKVSIQVSHPDPVLAAEAINAAFEAIEEVEQAMSLYRANSEIVRLNRDSVLENPSPGILRVLRFAQDLSQKSGGAFDVTIQPMWDLYESCASRSSLPEPEAVRKRKQSIGWQQLSIREQTIRLSSPDTKITLNGIAQGYATDQAKHALTRAGIKHALIDCGELAPLGNKGASTPWKVGIQHPRKADSFSALMNLETRTLATSGDYETRFSDDFKHHHIFDPRTGQSPAELASASVLAPAAMQADALSTTLMVLGAEKGLAFAEKMEAVDALLITKTGHILSTKHFPTL